MFGGLKGRVRGWFWKLRKRTPFFEKIKIKKYLQNHAVKKLQIGCGGQLRDGWLNGNYESWRKGTIFLDASKPFPVDGGQFDFVFSEHMIEHIPHDQGMRMLRECYRILKPGGVIRISTPDLQFLFNLYGERKTPLADAYLKWASGQLIGVLPSCEATFVINNFVRDWGHQFIYDEQTLRESLKSAGFSTIIKQQVNYSDHSELAKMDSESRMPEGFLRLESVVMEGVKPR